MAEQQPALEAERDGTAPPAEDTHVENTPVNEEQQPENPVEALAYDLGWRPKEEFRGLEEEWRPADQFIREGRDITRKVTKQLRSMEDQLQRVTRTSSQMMADKLAERDAYWQNVHAKAVEDNDPDTARKAVDELVKLKTAAPASETDAEPPETLVFRDRHRAWLGVDAVATKLAYDTAEFAHSMGKTRQEQLEAAEAAVRKYHPELFKPAAKQPAGVQTGAARHANTTKREKGFADMPAESQAMAKDYLKRHGIPLETTAKSYWADIARNERKVG